MSKKTNKKKIWLNANNHQLARKTMLDKMRSDININSRVFFAVSRKVNNETFVESTVETAQNKIEKPKSKKKKIWNTIFFILNIALVVYIFYKFAHEQGGVHSLSSLFAQSPRMTMLLIALGLFVFAVLFNTLKFAVLIKGRTKKWHLWFSFKLATIGRYYDLITPLGSGGQPFEIYYLKKNGFSAETSTAIPLAKYMAWQFTFCVISLFILIAYSHKLITSPVVMVCAWAGLGIIILLFVFVLFMSITKRFGASLVVIILKLLCKLHIVKDYKMSLIRVLRFIKQYQFTIKTFVKNPSTVIGEILATMGSMICNSSIAFFILIAFTSSPAFSWWDILCSCFICDMATAFIPLPGGSGAQEISFNALLGSLFPEGTLFWGVLLWRILTYYMYLLLGMGVVISNMFHHKKLKLDGIDELVVEPIPDVVPIEENKNVE